MSIKALLRNNTHLSMRYKYVITRTYKCPHTLPLKEYHPAFVTPTLLGVFQVALFPLTNHDREDKR